MNKAVIGLGFGDEGKGCTVNWLCSQANSSVIRFSGGSQAGHNVISKDTQHIFASGLCKLSNINEVDDLFDNIKSICGYTDLIHLNDSKTNYGSCIDMHECLCNGKIWKECNETLFYMIRKCKEYDTDMILETPNCMKDINLIIDHFNL